MQTTAIKRLTALVVFACAAPASAQSPDEVTLRRVTLARATTAANEGRHEEALDLALRAGRIHMTPSVRMFIATEQRALGLNVDALLSAQQCLTEATSNEALASRDVVLRRCAAVRAEAEARVGSVSLALPSPTPPELRVQVARRALAGAQLVLPAIVDPGEVLIEASAPGYAPLQQTVTVQPRQNVRVELTLVREQRTNTNEARPLPVGALVTVVSGGVLLAGSLGFFLAREEVTRGCEPDLTTTPSTLYCQDGELYDRASALAYPMQTLSAVSLGLGLAALGGGIAWWVLAHRTAARPPSQARIPWILPSGNGITLGVRGAL